MKKLIYISIGIILCSISLFFWILYLNLFNMGYTFLEFVKFILMRWECLILFVGGFMIWFNIERGK